MRTRFGIAAVAAMAATLSHAATVADAKGRLRIRKITFQYARCVVDAHHELASDAIVSDAANGEIMRHYSALIDGGCMARTGGAVQESFGGDSFRYALADALVSHDYAVAGPTDFSDRLPLAHLLPPDRGQLDAVLAATRARGRRAALQRSFDDRTGMVALSRYGECVVRRDPVGSRLWLLTPPDGPEERSRIDNLRPAFSACLGDGTVSFSRETMRGLVALNYYRLAMATPVPAAAKVN